MTSIFDALAVIGLRAEHQMTLHPLAHAMFDEAIKQILALDQDILNLERYETKAKPMYYKLYGEFNGKLKLKTGFIENVHLSIDHTEKFHNRIFKGNFEGLIYKVKRLILAKDRKSCDFSIRDFHWTLRKAYPDILEEIKQLLKSGRIPQPDYIDKPTAKWLGEFKPWVNPFEKKENKNAETKTEN
jgi:hypothetical protein